MPYDAVIFDLDGTLVDSETIALAAGRTVLARQGLELTDALFHSLVGSASDTGRDILRAHFGELDFDALDLAWQVESRRLSEAGVPLKPGVEILLSRLSGAGLPLAVATSSGRASARHKLDRTALAVHFAALVTRDCVTRPKPAPDPYLLAADRLRVDPRRCLAFEDSDTGAQSAFAAGMTVVQVPDLAPTTGRHATHVAADLLAGAAMAGLP